MGLNESPGVQGKASAKISGMSVDYCIELRLTFVQLDLDSARSTMVTMTIWTFTTVLPLVVDLGQHMTSARAEKIK